MTHDCTVATASESGHPPSCLPCTQWLSAIFKADSGIGIAVLDTETRILECNSAYCQILGYARDELVHVPIADLTHPDDAARNRNQINRLLADELPEYRIEKRYCRKDGATVWVDLAVSPIYTDKGTIEALVAIATDISERKQAEEDLRTSERRFRHLFQSMINGCALHEIILDDAGTPYDYRFLSVNPAFERLTGLRARALIGRTVLEVMPQTESHWIETYGQVALTGRPARFESYAKELDRWFAVSAFSPQPGQFATIFSDVTENKKADADLRASERQFRTLAENLPDLVGRFDRACRHRFVNGHAVETTGLAYEDLVGKTPREAGFPEELCAFWEDRIAVVFETGEPMRDEFRLMLRGHLAVFDWRLIPEYNEEGALTTVLSICRDITGERDLRDRLRQSEKMQAIGELVGGVAHDFNNQLAGIQGYADLLLLRLSEDPTLQRYGEMIARGCTRASNLTRQLLSFSRKERDRDEVVDLHDVIAEVIDLLKHSIDKRIVIRKYLTAETPLTKGDSTALQNALLNLAINARDAMTEGGQIIFTTETAELDAEAAESLSPGFPPGSYLVVMVTDNGCGMTEEVKTRVFEPFFTTKAPGQGTGMGLAAVFSTVQRHGGSIQIETAPQQGTTFSLYLPLAEKPETPEAEEADASVNGQTARILVVDDEPMVRMMATDMLKQLGHTVVSCANGIEAVKRYQKDRDAIDVILLDFMMPKQTGVETLQILKEIDPDVRVIISSGYTENEAVAQASLDEGARAFVNKPFNAVGLTRAIDDALSHPQSNSSITT